MSKTLSVIYKSTEDLIPYVNNSRTHSEQQITQVASSIKEFGFTNPILIDETGGIIAGHGRLMAAKKLGMNEVPTITLSELSEAQRKAYVIADNKLALNSGWDSDFLQSEISILADFNFDINILGFDESELANLFDENDVLIEPELKEQTYNEVFNIIIECSDESEQEKIFNRLDQEGYKCRVQSL
tara:strand:- start:549 stop:1106 length:558 start_codon:yes stop_codon:yes gene_type:complete